MSDPQAGAQTGDHPERRPDRLSFAAVVKRAVAEFNADQCTDLAAGLTYYSVLAIFPALIALLSLLGVVGQADASTNAVLNVLRPLLDAGFLENQVRPFVESLANSRGAGLGLAIGVVVALFSASGYVTAFGRAMNRVLEVDEGRPVWILRPVQLVVTLVAIVLVAAALVILVVSGPVARSVGDAIGAGSTAVSVWNVAKWPALLVVVTAVVALLYWATPNVKQPKFRWLSVGALVAIVIWVLASVGFAFYVANFGSYNKTYGSLAFVVIALLWVWLTNLALLFGAELDSELERRRQLEAGLPAEARLQLPMRDNRQVRKADEKRRKLVAEARAVREDDAR